MKISYSWLKDYIDVNLTPEQIADILTQTGLEVGGVETIEQIKGGLRGVVIGKVISCSPHPNSDHLSITKVDINGEQFLPIVCGAPNVDQGQKVPVATIGTIFYDGDKEFIIKKTKLRGELSMGMICSEKELGLGEGDTGIMVLPEDAKVGTPANEYFNLSNDYQIDIDLTPNRIDGASHIGVARDLAAYLQAHGTSSSYRLPSVDAFSYTQKNKPVEINIENYESCPRYAGVCVSNVKVAPSPEWLQKKLISIDLTPINNVVDITNYLLFETGQPLHAFDRSKIGNSIKIKTLKEGTKFTTLDEVERNLHKDDLMICAHNDTPMCIAGVFGGIDSGITDDTTDIFLESAYFNPVQVRKTARRHAINTDASFRFERGVDPNNIIYTLKRAAILISEIAGGTISSNITDVYPKKIEGASVNISLQRVERLSGVKIPKEQILTILKALEIEIKEDKGEELKLLVPAYRVDVTREADIIEEILRIYGYNNIPLKSKVSSVLNYEDKPNTYKIKNKIADYLSANGFNEIMNNSLTKVAYYEGLAKYPTDKAVLLQNPLSQDLGTMRQTLLFGGLESMIYNINRKSHNLAFYEFGKTYHYSKNEDEENPLKNYNEFDKLGIFITGNIHEASWNSVEIPTDFFRLKAVVFNILEQLGVKHDSINEQYLSDEIFAEALTLKIGKTILATVGKITKSISQILDITQPVFYAEVQWDNIMEFIKNRRDLKFKPLAKYPAVRRDFALLIDEQVTFDKLKSVIKQTEKKLLHSISLFDVYTGDKLPKGKKSYAVSVVLQDESSTLTEKQIDKVSQKLKKAFEKQLGATIR